MLKKTIDHIFEFTETLTSNDSNKAVTKHFVVLPILRDLEWNCDNLENLEVFPDKNTESGTVDYALQHDGKSRVFIVVKQWPTEPDPDELYDETALYASQEEVDFVVLTNGKTWHFYLPNLPDVPWETRRFCSIELDNRAEAVSDFQKYLSKPHVLDASAREAAEAIVKKPEKPTSQELLRRVRKIIREIEDKSASGDYIFRGEPECYPKVSSTLYRQYEEILIDGSNVEDFQHEMLIAAQEHLPGTTSDFETPVRRLDTAIGLPSEPDGYFETLTELQHYGGKTNLIDFTTDSRVALFFACDGSPGRDGRVILKKRGDIEELVGNPPREPSNPLNRVIAQKSIFVRPRQGFVEFDRDKDVVEIPADIKKPMLGYLQKYNNISAKTIYNDLHGFIRTQDIHHRAYDELYSGLSAADKDDLDKAIQHYNKAIELKPDFHLAYNNRGIAYGKKGDFDSAIKDFNKAIELNPNLAEAYNNSGLVYEKKGEIDTAIHNHNKAIELNPNDAGAYNNRGVTYGKKGDFDSAIKDFNKAIELNSNDAEAYNNRGLAYLQKGEIDTAIHNYSKAIELNPNLAKAYNNRGTAYLQKGELDNAIHNYSRAIELKPNRVKVYNNRGKAYGGKGEFDNAIADFNKAIELNPVDVEAYYNRGNAYFQKGDFDNAIKDFTKTIELNPVDTEAYSNRGTTYLQKGEVHNAINDFTTAIERNPVDTEAYCNRGTAYFQKGELDNAIQDYTMAIERKPDFANAYYNRGTAYGQKGELDNAINDFTTAIEINPDYATAYNNRGVAHRKKDEFDNAIQDYDKAIERKPDYATAYYNRGNAYLQKGEVHNAINDYTTAIELNPVDTEAYCNRGKAWMRLRKWDKAKADLTVAKDSGVDIIASFHNNYESVADFEQKNGVTVPEDIKEMLTLA